MLLCVLQRCRLTAVDIWSQTQSMTSSDNLCSEAPSNNFSNRFTCLKKYTKLRGEQNELEFILEEGTKHNS